MATSAESVTPVRLPALCHRCGAKMGYRVATGVRVGPRVEHEGEVTLRCLACGCRNHFHPLRRGVE